MVVRIKNKKKQTPETNLKKGVKDALSALGWFHWHNLQGMGAYKGLPDIEAIKYGMTIYIEVKSKNGNQTDLQKQFEENIEAKKGVYILVDDIDSFIQQLKNIDTVYRERGFV